MVDEAHVTTFAVAPAVRRRRIGERLLLALLDLAVGPRAREATLEVRLSNLPARRLYEKYGFRPVGIRPRYYSDNHEDALIMTTEPLGRPSMRDADRRACGRSWTRRPARREPDDREPRRRGRRLGAQNAPGGRMSGPLLLAVESSCDETGIALVEDGRRIHANVVASQVAMHAPTGGIVPEVAARAHLRWIVPVLDEALADGRRDHGRRRRRRRDLRPRAGGLAARRASTSPRRSPGSTASRSSRSTTSRATSTPAGCSTRARRSARRRRSRWSRWSCRAGTRSSSRCATT